MKKKPKKCIVCGCIFDDGVHKHHAKGMCCICYKNNRNEINKKKYIKHPLSLQPKPDKCIKCGCIFDYAHHYKAKGLCEKCYDKIQKQKRKLGLTKPKKIKKERIIKERIPLSNYYLNEDEKKEIYELLYCFDKQINNLLDYYKILNLYLIIFGVENSNILDKLDIDAQINVILKDIKQELMLNN